VNRGILGGLLLPIENRRKRMRRTLTLLTAAVVMAAMAVLMAVAGAAPVAFAQGEEIAVTGVIKDAPDKADGTPAYGITDESTVSGTAPPIGYILEGDYSAYVGQRVTVYGTPRQSGEHRVLDVTRIV
jgi:hypothetical protein